MAQRYEYQDIEGYVILLFVHPAFFQLNVAKLNSKDLIWIKKEEEDVSIKISSSSSYIGNL